MTNETVPIHLVTRLVVAMRRRGSDVEKLLARAGISQEVAHNPRARVTLDQLAALTRTTP